MSSDGRLVPGSLANLAAATEDILATAWEDGCRISMAPDVQLGSACQTSSGGYA